MAIVKGDDILAGEYSERSEFIGLSERERDVGFGKELAEARYWLVDGEPDWCR